jgi:hypothetical protein
MVHEVHTTATPDEVLDRAEAFFAERVPNQAAFPERRGPGHLLLRGQGGEEIALAAVVADGHTAVRASTLLFDHAVARFLTTLPSGSVGG